MARVEHNRESHRAAEGDRHGLNNADVLKEHGQLGHLLLLLRCERLPGCDQVGRCLHTSAQPQHYLLFMFRLRERHTVEVGILN